MKATRFPINRSGVRALTGPTISFEKQGVHSMKPIVVGDGNTSCFTPTRTAMTLPQGFGLRSWGAMR